MAPRGRPSLMADEEARKKVAEIHANGGTRADIVAEFGVHESTVTTWLQREDVKAEVDRIIRDRTHRILRKVDTRIEVELANVDKMKLEDLLKVRKEFLPDRKEIKLNVSQEDALAELFTAAADDPEAAAKILGLDLPDDEQD